MHKDFATAMGRALEQARASNPAEATRIIQAVLAKRPEAARTGTVARAVVSRPVDGVAARAGHREAEAVERRPSGRSEAPRRTPDAEEATSRPRRSLRAVIEALSRRPGSAPLTMPGQHRTPSSPPVADGAVWQTRTFSCAAGARDYRLYVPAAMPNGPQGLVLMLHGCTQDADDFASGTRMNDVAERHGLLVAYPNQTRLDNAQGCWNWFRPADQGRAGGEPAVLAGLAAALQKEFRLPTGRVFAAGLSAGGAMAAILGANYPDVFSAVAVHSGLPHGAARDVVSAFAAMRGEIDSTAIGTGANVRTIVFHGTADATVHPANAEHVMRVATADLAALPDRTARRSAGGRAFTRRIAAGPDGAVVAELWLIEGAGHAWSGGSSTGSYADPSGPDASAEFIRFFLQGADGATG